MLNKQYSISARIVLESMVDQRIVKVIKNITVSDIVFEEIKEFCTNNKNVIMKEIADDEIHISLKRINLKGEIILKRKMYLIEEVEINTDIDWWNVNRKKLNNVIRKFNKWQTVDKFDEYEKDVVLAMIDSCRRIEGDRDFSDWQYDILNDMENFINSVNTEQIENEDEETISVRYIGEETGTFTFYQCEDCGYLEITSDASYCPGCGKKIKYWN